MTDTLTPQEETLSTCPVCGAAIRRVPVAPVRELVERLRRARGKSVHGILAPEMSYEEWQTSSLRRVWQRSLKRGTFTRATLDRILERLGVHESELW